MSGTATQDKKAATAATKKTTAQKKTTPPKPGTDATFVMLLTAVRGVPTRPALVKLKNVAKMIDEKTKGTKVNKDELFALIQGNGPYNINGLFIDKLIGALE